MRTPSLLAIGLIALFTSTLPILPAGVAAEPATMFADRVVSFHGGPRKDIIELAAELGFNEAQFQLERGNVERLKSFASREEKGEGYVKFCHDHGMKVSLWIHELEDLPKDIGPITLENEFPLQTKTVADPFFHSASFEHGA